MSPTPCWNATKPRQKPRRRKPRGRRPQRKEAKPPRKHRNSIWRAVTPFPMTCPSTPAGRTSTPPRHRQRPPPKTATCLSAPTLKTPSKTIYAGSSTWPPCRRLNTSLPPSSSTQSTTAAWWPPAWRRSPAVSMADSTSPRPRPPTCCAASSTSTRPAWRPVPWPRR